MIATSAAGAEELIRLTRVYAPGPTVARQAGSFAHAVVLASLLPADWQFGEDADRLTRALVNRALHDVPHANTLRVEVQIDMDDQFFEVHLTTDSGWHRREHVRPRRPFATTPCHTSGSGSSGPRPLHDHA